jgi:hypothetical protein
MRSAERYKAALAQNWKSASIQDLLRARHLCVSARRLALLLVEQSARSLNDPASARTDIATLRACVASTPQFQVASYD